MHYASCLTKTPGTESHILRSGLFFLAMKRTFTFLLVFLLQLTSWAAWPTIIGPAVPTLDDLPINDPLGMVHYVTSEGNSYRKELESFNILEAYRVYPGGNAVFALASGSTASLALKANLASPTFTGTITLPTGSTSNAPLKFVSGTNLTSPASGAKEFDGAQFYGTIDTTSGRGALPVEQYFHLTSNGTNISTIANFFGANSNISLVENAHYIIDVYCVYTNTTTGTLTWTFTNSAAPSHQNIHIEMSPIAGIVAPATLVAAYLSGDIIADTTAAKALGTTGTLATGVNHFARFRIFLINGAGTNLKIQATKLVGGTITPLKGSWWVCRRVSPNNIGTFAP
mgnify:CR=1 FL=1